MEKARRWQKRSRESKRWRKASSPRLITADPFSFTRAGEPFVAFEYGSQLLYALVHRAGGLAGVAVLASLLIASAYALLARFLLARGVDALLAYIVTGMLGIMISLFGAFIGERVQMGGGKTA